MAQGKLNPNPVVYDIGMRDDAMVQQQQQMMKMTISGGLNGSNGGNGGANGYSDVITAAEVYDYIRDIMDPEHPYTLEQLKVVEPHKIHVEDDGQHCLIVIEFTPTVPHCSLATLIGLCMREKLVRNLGRMFKLDIFVTKGKHSTEAEINKQVNDKERVAAALENPNLFQIVEQCIKERG